MEIKEETDNHLECMTYDNNFDPLEKCRCCFKLFDDDENQLKITKMIIKRFMEITQIELKTSSIYPSTICELCNNELRNFSKFRDEIIAKQEKFYSSYEENLKEEFPSELRPEDDVEPRSLEEELQYPNSIFDDPLEPEVHIEIKTELEDCVHDEITSKENLPELSEIRTPLINNLKLCQYCDKYYHYQSIKKHIEVVHLKIRRFACSSCDFRTAREDRLLKHHQLKHDPTNSYNDKDRKICPQCGILVKELDRHVRRVHLKEKNYFCEFCGFGSITKSILERHIKCHLPKDQQVKIPCIKCDHVSMSKESMAYHRRTKHSEENLSFPCLICEKIFTFEKSLIRHTRHLHENVREHVCLLCEKSFSTSSDLKKHSFTHIQEQIPCEICGKIFQNVLNLKQHLRIHTDPKFKCNIDGCDKGFYFQSHLKDHQTKHSNQKNFICHICKKSFFLAKSLQRHFHTHKTQKLLCDIPGCSSDFSRKDTYRRHIISSHKELSFESRETVLSKIKDIKMK